MGQKTKPNSVPQVDPTGQPFVVARALGLYSIAAGRMLKAVLAGYDAAERRLLAGLLSTLDANDLLVLDRGFPAVWLFALLQQQQRHFIARIDGAQWPEVQDFVPSGRAEQGVIRPLGRDTRRQARALGLEWSRDEIRFRFTS
jgi:hypothetical protein